MGDFVLEALKFLKKKIELPENFGLFL